MKVIFVGDVVGRPGRRALAALLPQLITRHGADLVVVNGENAAGGLGLTEETAIELFKAGAHVLTTGNHVWKKKDFVKFLDTHERVLRPANYPPGAPGRGYAVVPTAAGTQVGVVNLAGRTFMDPLDCPFRVGMEIVEHLRERCSVILVDFHAEATSEKVAMGWFLDGKATAIFGTHTHVQTADERILPGGTAYITDVGMTGPVDSVIGVKKDLIIEKFTLQIPVKFEVASGPVVLGGAVVEADEITGRATNISRIQEIWEGGNA
ncbi:MAG TPA: TIGR00282 family metallophosphoesterase [Firmicutes bacterium]|nr:TIGR00282 family metallophosphoesterase [Bacillota bacterium]